MDKLGDEKMSEAGILTNLLKQTPMAGLNLTPQLTQNEIVIEMTEQQLRELLLQSADERAKKAVSIQLKEGKLVLIIKLF